MELKLGKQLQSGFKKESPLVVKKPKVEDILKGEESYLNKDWRYFVFPIPILISVFAIFGWTLFNMQVLSYDKYKERADGNRFEVVEIKPNRGLILDRNGNKLAENTPAVSIYLDTSEFINPDLSINQEKLLNKTRAVEKVLGEDWKKSLDSKGFNSLYDKVVAIWDKYSVKDKAWVSKVEILSSLSNESALKIKAQSNTLTGVSVVDGSKRYYPYGEMLSHILGYTGDVYYEDLSRLNYVSYDDTIGKSGLELTYDKALFGNKGKVAQEKDSLGNIVENGVLNVTPSVSGSSIYTTLDVSAQKVLYNALKNGVKKYKADGGAAIVEDIQTGEILAMASYPSYNNNAFVGGISQKDYNSILKSGVNPLLNRAIGAQVPPGSTFKTIVASAALDAGALNTNTIYVSRRGYTFSNGKIFQEYNNNAYGALNVIGALSVSSNIFFCETIRHWDMDKLVVYLDKFGIGKVTNIDLLDEGSGRLPSPENKIKLAKSSSPWLDPVWYPEGDSCNSVIGQGITTVTPIQMVNWVSAIANGGTLNTPHLVNKLEKADGSFEIMNWSPLQTKLAKDSALKIVREGMWGSVNGPRRVIIPLSGAKVTVAAKTGTAEFGRLNSQGRYEHTHAWVTGFFPYEKPKYAFVVFLEDGGASNNSAAVAREFIDWWSTHKK